MDIYKPLIALLAIVKWKLFGSLLPETFHARLAPRGRGIEYLVGGLLPTGLELSEPIGGTPNPVAAVSAAHKSDRNGDERDHS